jgi:hypothetical protein
MLSVGWKNGDFLRAQVGIICTFSKRIGKDFCRSTHVGLEGATWSESKSFSKQLFSDISSTEK